MRTASVILLFAFCLSLVIVLFTWSLRIGFINHSAYQMLECLVIASFVLLAPQLRNFVFKTSPVLNTIFIDPLLSLIAVFLIVIAGVITSYTGIKISFLFQFAGYAFIFLLGKQLNQDRVLRK